MVKLVPGDRMGLSPCSGISARARAESFLLNLQVATPVGALVQTHFSQEGVSKRLLEHNRAGSQSSLATIERQQGMPPSETEATGNEIRDAKPAEDEES